MKNLLKLAVLLLTISTLFACHAGVKKVEIVNNTKDTITTLRGKSLRTGVIAPLFIKSNMANVYSIGDTVWVYTETNDIQPNVDWDVRASSSRGKFQAYKLEGSPLIIDSAKYNRIEETLNKLDRINWGEH